MITVYTVGAGCAQCALTIRRLTDLGIPFQDIDLTDPANDAAHEYVAELGYTQAPVVVASEHNHWSGFNWDKLTALTHLTQEAS